jgi:hypothetical protein
MVNSMLQMAQRKTLNSMMNTGVCLKFARSPNLIFKSQTRKYSNIQRNKNKKEPKKWWEILEETNSSVNLLWAWPQNKQNNRGSERNGTSQGKFRC